MTDRVTLRLRAGMPERFIVRALREGVRLLSVERTGAREMELCASENNARRLLELAEAYGIDLSVTGEAGRPRLKRQLRRRSTLPLGLILGIMLTTCFTARIWQVEAVSLDGAADSAMLRAICEMAEDMGARPGRLRSDINREMLALRLQAEWPELAHVSVRLDGVYLRVEVAAEEPAPEVYEIDAGRDLVASRDAVIVYVEPLAGKACVKPGDAVRRGQTLILGEERTGGEAVRGIRALGQVTGRIWFTGEYRAQMTETVVRRTGNRQTRVQLRLGSRSWLLKEAEGFAQQEAETEIIPIGGLFLPLRIERTVFRETVQTNVPRDTEALRSEAGERALGTARASVPEAAEETGSWVDFTEENGILTARATVEAQMNIAAERGEIID